MITQNWREVLFLHWPVEAAALRPLVPLELELFEGRAWLSVVAFEMTRNRLCDVPLPRVLEVNVRTYVKGGVYFLSLDASNAFAVWLARAWYGLPYFRARMSLAREGERVRYESRRRGAEFVARYGPAGPVAVARPGTLEHFLVERYALFAVRRGRTLRVDVQHEPWPLQPAAVSVEACTLPPVRVEGAPLAHFAREVHARISGPVRV
ncbi:MAG: YqjF family protein [Planctomycetota bacterium]